MSPVSRGRKSKKSKKRSPGKAGSSTPKVSSGGTGINAMGVPVFDRPQVGAARSALSEFLGPAERPEWFDSSIKAILDQADVVMGASGPRELEQVTAELLGAELHHVVHHESDSMWFDWLYQELADASAARVLEGLGFEGGSWEGPWRLLYGLTSIGSPALRSTAEAAIGRVKKNVRAAAVAEPEWLGMLPKIAATGEVWEMHDAYGDRFGVIAAFCYPGGTDPSFFLFDIDASFLVKLAAAGTFDDVDQAAEAWRSAVGESADQATPTPVETTDRLACLAHSDGEEMIGGFESRTRMDNWYRARRRHHDLADALRKRRTPLPVTESLYGNIDTEPLVAEFTAWHRKRHGDRPDPEMVDALAAEWLQGMLPGTLHAASPARIAHQLALIGDWFDDDPVTVGVKALMPAWARWHGEQAGLPEHLIERAVAAASGIPVAAPEA